MEEYAKGFSLRDLFLVSTSGIVTARDSVVIDTDKNRLKKRMQYFFDLRNSDDDVRTALFAKKSAQKYAAGDTRGWKLSEQRKKKPDKSYSAHIQNITDRLTIVLFSVPQMIDWGREDVMHHLIHEGNIGLIFKRGGTEVKSPPVFITKTLIDFETGQGPVCREVIPSVHHTYTTMDSPVPILILRSYQSFVRLKRAYM